VRLPGCARPPRALYAEIGTAGAGMEEPAADGSERRAFAVSPVARRETPDRPIRGSAGAIGRGQRSDSPRGPLRKGLPKLYQSVNCDFELILSGSRFQTVNCTL